MKLSVVLTVVFVGLVAAAEEKASRQLLFGGRANCVDTWHLNNNPCTNNPMGQTYMPHPSDNTKFIQCAQLGRMFVIQCPSGEVYDRAASNCVRQTVITQPIVTNPIGTTGNPCNAQNIAAGNIYFAVSNANNKFIECDLNGNANVLTCPQALIWDESRLSCVVSTTTAVSPAILSGIQGQLTATGVTTNPCTAQAIAAKTLFFPHPDASKFIQCDLEGNAFVQQCPSGLVWNQYQETCASPFNAQATIGGVLVSQPGVMVG